MPLGLTSRSNKEIFEDWTGATNIGTSATAAGITWMNSSDTGNTAFVITDTAQGPLARSLTDTTDDDMCEIAHRALTWSAQNGRMELETRVRVNVGAVASVAFSVGFNDDQLEDSNTLPVELATATFTSNATTFCGVLFDPDATNADFHGFWVDDDADAGQTLAALRFTGIGPVLTAWVGVKVVVDEAGSGVGCNLELSVAEENTGKYGQKNFTLTVDRDALLVPHIAYENRGSTAHTFDIDYILARETRAA